ncbi:hypothetical protein ACA910_009856 [Epithemia clementina (nom. ined.)]
MEMKQQALDIVKEQVEMIANLTMSWSSTSSPVTRKRVALYYNTLSDGNHQPITNGKNTTTTNATVAPTLGHVLVQQLIQDICARYRSCCFATCQHLAHFPDGGDESITLSSVHQYCRKRQPQKEETEYQDFISNGSPSKSKPASSQAQRRSGVTYLHNKGSFHNSLRNQYWRQALTAAVLHPDCLHPPTPARLALTTLHNATTILSIRANDDGKSNSTITSYVGGTCNVCGLSFEPAWTQFFPGNMWTADCDYVEKLVSPNGTTTTGTTSVTDVHQSNIGSNNLSLSSLLFFENYDYAQRKHDLADWARSLDKSPKNQKYRFGMFNFTNHLYPTRYNRGDVWGTGRFANEHWIGSHPDLIPCDVSTLHFRAWMKESYLKMNFSWSMAPRRSLFTNPPGYLPHVSDNAIVKVIQEEPELRRYEYSLLAGSLYRWIGLYNQTPAFPSSWVWSFFPDAEYWQSQIPSIRSNLLLLLLRQHQEQQKSLSL